MRQQMGVLTERVLAEQVPALVRLSAQRVVAQLPAARLLVLWR
jgi:hypothetical protein